MKKYLFSVAKATLHSQMSVRSSVHPSIHSFICLSAKPLNSLKSSSFIIYPSSFFIHHSSFIIPHSSFLHFATFKLFSLFLNSFISFRDPCIPVRGVTKVFLSNFLVTVISFETFHNSFSLTLPKPLIERPNLLCGTVIGKDNSTASYPI